MKKKVSKWEKLGKALLSFLSFAIVIIAVSIYFLLNGKPIGFAFLSLGVIGLLILKILKIEFKKIYPDFIFGFVDNSIMVFGAILGGYYAGVTGAVIGGAVGNTVTDGIGGLFEGHIADYQREYKIDNRRTAQSTTLGKMTGCLFGAGLSLTIVWLIGMI